MGGGDATDETDETELAAMAQSVPVEFGEAAVGYIFIFRRSDVMFIGLLSGFYFSVYLGYLYKDGGGRGFFVFVFPFIFIFLFLFPFPFPFPFSFPFPIPLAATDPIISFNDQSSFFLK